MKRIFLTIVVLIGIVFQIEPNFEKGNKCQIDEMESNGKCVYVDAYLQ